MLKNYLRIALRNLRKQKGFTFINVFGLAVGLACCLLIMLYVMDELSYDRFHAKANHIYRIQSDVKFGGNDMHMAVSPDPMGPTLLKDYPQVANFTRLYSQGSYLVRKAGADNNLREQQVLYADSTVFEVFTLPLISGNPKTALIAPRTVVISATAAKRHFNSQNPIGQMLMFDNQEQPYKVTGVMHDIPQNSHFHADFLISMRSSDYEYGNFLSFNHYTYLVLKEGVNYKDFNKSMAATLRKYGSPQLMQVVGATWDQVEKSGSYLNLSLIPLTDIHLYSRQTVELSPNGDIQYVYIFSAVAIFILLIACINFMNLSTARSSNRAKEVGVRKVLGSFRNQLIGQFMTESVLMAVLGLLLAVLIVWMVLPFFNDISAKHLTITHLFGVKLLPFILFLPFGVGFLAGSYPAFYLSSFQPISVLKGKLNLGLKSSSLRSTLVVFQFAMSVILIVGTIVVYRQINYIQTTNLGFNKDQVLIVSDAYALDKQAETFKNEMLRLPGVTSGTLSGFLPVPSNRSDSPFFPEGVIDQKKAVSMQNWRIDYDYLKTMGMTMVKGRNFSREFGTDSTGILLNESAARLFGFKEPIGKRISRILDDQGKQIKTFTIIGIVKDFHYESLRQNIGSLGFVLGRSTGAAAFRVSTQNLPALVKEVEHKWRTLAPSQPFNYTFMEDDFDTMYRAEQRIGKIALTFAILAIMIACLGLFGLAAFIAEQRTKEIGIRKVLGASVMSITTLLSKDFLRLVLISIVIATPLAWYAMSLWLQDFAYRIDVAWWMFALAGLLAVGIALFTVSFQAIKAALMNPVKSLRAE